jgi:DNA-binding GntR family transcriptional regulator
MAGLVRIPLAHQVYLELRAKIISGELPSGSRLLPEGLAESMEISQTPVKEALVRLEADGLVEAQSRRGAVVRRFTPSDVDELYEARTLIELNAVRTALRDNRVLAGVIEEMAGVLVRHAAQIERHNEDGLGKALALDREFHAKLVGLGGNGLISEWHTKIMRQTHTMWLYSPDDYPINPTVHEHEEILAALSSGDVNRTVIALQQHLTRSRTDMLHRQERRRVGLSLEPETKN